MNQGKGGRWTMRYEIINALLLREAANQRTTMEKWIGYKEEGSLIPRVRETPYKVKASELRDNESPTLNKASSTRIYLS